MKYLFTIVTFILLLTFLLIFFPHDVCAQKISLKRLDFAENDDIAAVGDTLEVGVFIDTEEYLIYGFKIYLTFYDEYFKIVDQNPIQDGIQPFVGGDLLSDINELHNNTEGDIFSGEDNGQSGFQLNYSKLMGAYMTPVQGSGTAAKFKLVAKKSTPEGGFTKITIDNQEFQYRETVIYYKDNGMRRSKRFQTKKNLNLVVTGTSISLPSFIELHQDSTELVLYLDNFVSNPELQPNQISWSISPTTVANTTINSLLRTVTITRIFGKEGSEEITFTAAPQGGNPIKGFTTLVVHTKPSFWVPLPDIIFKEDSFAVIRLNEYIIDPADPILDLTWVVSNNQAINVDIENAVATISAPQNWYGSQDSIIIKAIDTDDFFAADTLNVTVTSVNDAPVILDFDHIFMPDTIDSKTINLSSHVTDVDDERVSLVWTVDSSEHVSFNFKNNQDSLEIIKKNEGFKGIAQVFISVQDSAGLSDADTLIIVCAGDVTSLFFPDTIAIQEDLPDTLQLNSFLLSPYDKSIFSWSAESSEHIEVTIEEDSIGVFTPDTNWFGAEEINFAVQDTSGFVVHDTVVVNVISMNDPPQIGAIPPFLLRVGEIKYLNLNEFAFDIEDDVSDLKWEAGSSDHFDIIIDSTENVMSCSLIVRDWKGTEEISLKVIDTGNLSDSTTFIVTSSGLDTTYTFLPDLEFNEDEQTSLNLFNYIVSNTPDDLLEWSFSVSDNISVTISANGIADFVPSENWFGLDSIIFSITDTSEITVYDTVAVLVNPINDPPVIVSAPETEAVEGHQYTYNVTVVDVDNSSLLYDLFIKPGWLAIDAASGVISGIPFHEDIGTHQVEVQVSDYDTTIAQNFTIEVKGLIPLVHTPVTETEAGNTISISVLGSSSTILMTLFYKNGGETVFSTKQMINISDSTWSATIDSQYVNSKGIMYYVAASDGETTGIIPPTGEAPFSMSIRNAVSYTREPVQDKAYIMISVPVSTEDTSAAAVFSELGRYDKSKWRIFTLDSSDSYIENAGIVLGKSFWLFTVNPVVLDAVGVSSNQGNSYEIPLFPGWNMIGNPFDFEIYWGNAGIKTGTGTFSLNGSEADNYVRKKYWTYEDTSGNYLNDGYYVMEKGVFGPEDKMMPWKGYLMYCVQNCFLSLSPSSEPSAADKIASLSPGSDKSWEVQLIAETDVSKDQSNYFGISSGASADYDGYDSEKPPSPFDDISLYFPHFDWDKNSGKFAADFRNCNESDEIWNFEVQSRKEKVTLSWKIEEGFPEDYNLYLIDIESNLYIDMKKKQVYTYRNEQEDIIRTFNIVYSLDEAPLGLSIPESFEIFQNYPNPFNLETTIRYQVPEYSRVKIEIFNILGQKVKTLVEQNHSPGYYEAVWDGRNDNHFVVSSGIYIFALKSEKKMKAKKMLLVK